MLPPDILCPLPEGKESCEREALCSNYEHHCLFLCDDNMMNLISQNPKHLKLVLTLNALQASDERSLIPEAGSSLFHVSDEPWIHEWLLRQVSSNNHLLDSSGRSKGSLVPLVAP